ncbi:PstS family phosphate ABC transporter substrate-binding protein [Flavobacterium sp.]|uniref:PstS family phosphate ABC transporter substrate-binding protein n=1 Tax=Flavobacterium sp. TaxID=239 RepID=UPI0037511EED
MKNKIILFSIVSIFAIAFACNKKSKNEDTETILKGKVTVLVDETLLPIIEDQVEVFQSQYDGATINLVGKSESEIVQLLSKNKNQLAILSRELTKSEGEIFEIKKIRPKVTLLATDGIALISHRNNNDTLINVEDIVDFVQGKNNNKFKGIVFDNPNSSTVRYIKELAKIDKLPVDKVFSFKTNNEVIKFVSNNEGMIGVVGVNWLTQPSPEMGKIITDVKVLSVKFSKDKNFVKPSQDPIASRLYPLTREIKMLNYQPNAGLGMGFASFMAGEIGQRIILKSGLVPVRIPSRNIVIRKGIENKNNK